MINPLAPSDIEYDEVAKKRREQEARTAETFRQTQRSVDLRIKQEGEQRDEYTRREAQKLRASHIEAESYGLAPEQLASTLNDARLQGVPDAVAIDNHKEIKTEAERRRLELIESPAVKQFLSDPVNQALAKDDIDALEKIAKNFNEQRGTQGLGTASSPYESGYTAVSPYDNLSAEQQATMREVETNPKYAPGVKEKQYRTKSPDEVFNMAPSGAWVKMADGSLKQRETTLTDLLYGIPRGVVNLTHSGAGLGVNILRAITPEMDANTLGGTILAKRDATPLLGGGDESPEKYTFKDIRQSDSVMDAILKVPTFVAQGIIASLPDMAGAVVALPAYIAALTEQGAQARAANDGRAGKPEFMDYVIGHVSAQIQGRFEKFATKRLAPGAGAVGGSVAARLGTEFAVQGGTEGFEGLAQYTAENLGTQKGFDTVEALDATAGGALIGMGLGGTVQGGKEAYRAADRSAASTVRRVFEVHEAQGEKATLDNLVNIADTTKIKKLAPGKFESYVRSFGEGDVHIPVESVQTYYQGAGLDAAKEIANLTDSDSAYAEALATGGEIAIPIDKYVARIGVDAHKVLGETARLKPAQTVKPNTPMPDNAEFEAGVQAAIQDATPVAQGSESGPVYDAVYGLLQGQVDTYAAKQYASQAQAWYATQAGRMGITPEALFDQFKINMPQAIEAAKSRAKVDFAYDPVLDALRAKRFFTDKEIHGEGLVSGLMSKGGIRPDVMGSGDLRAMDANKARPGFFNNNGMTMDEAVTWAKENGYAQNTNTENMGNYDADGFDINSLLELIRDDLAGFGSYAAENQRTTRARFNDDMNSMADVLRAREIDIDKMSNAEIKALLMADESTYEQGNDQTDTPEFKKWFGDSKVVDADGNPLVVYHGTANDFDVFDNAKTGLNDRGLWGRGHYFSAVSRSANSYALRQDGEARIIPAYVSITNPLILKTSFDLITRLPDGTNARELIGENLDGAKIKAIAQSGGHDGVIQIKPDGLIGDLVAYEPNQIKSATGNNGEFDPNNTSILFQGKGEKAPKGKIAVKKQADGTIEFDIHLLKGKNFSTFLHETGHAYLEIFQALANRDNAPADIKADWEIIKKHLGVEGDAALTTEQHEKWARSNEAYLREGKAPSAALRPVFSAFKLWLGRIYKTAGDLNVELSDDVRGVMDRMFASDAEIAEAKKSQNLGPLFKDMAASGYTQAEQAEYEKLVNDAQAEAENQVAVKLLAAEQRANAAWYRDETKKMAVEIGDALSREPVYVAKSILKNGEYANGDAAPDAVKVKLDKAELLDRLGPTFAKRFNGMTAETGGVSADVAASLFGFKSGAEMLETMTNSGPFKEVVKAETKSAMEAKYPDPLMDGTLPQLAMNAVHSDKMGDVMVAEINLLEKRTNKTPTTLRVMREAARRMVAAKRLRDISTASYQMAEQKAGRAALEAASKQDWEGARVARRQQLLNHQLYRAAVDARETAGKQHRFLSKFVGNKKSAKKMRGKVGKMGEAFLSEIDSLLDQVDLRQSGRTADGKTHYRDLTVTELQTLHDEIKGIYNEANDEDKLRIGDELRDRAVIDGNMSASVADAHGVVTSYGSKTGKQKLSDVDATILGAIGTASNIARDLDGQKDGGAVWDNTVRIIREAVTQRLNPALAAGQKSIADLYASIYSKAEIRALNVSRAYAGVPGVWEKQAIMAMALLYGSDGGKSALFEQTRDRLTPEQIFILFSHLDAKDLALVNGMWPLMNGYWPELAKLSRRLTGLVPEKVEAVPYSITLQDGTVVPMRGGYMPLKYEGSLKTARQTLDDDFKSMQTGQIAIASTKRGMTIERVGSGGNKVTLNLASVDSHVRDVIRAIHLTEPVNYVARVLRGNEFTSAVNDAGMEKHVVMLDKWLQDVAVGEKVPNAYYSAQTRFLKQNFTAAVLTYKVASAALQITGLSQSAVVLGSRNVLYGLNRYLKNPMAAGKYVDEAAPFITQRAGSSVESVEDLSSARKSVAGEWRGKMILTGFIGIAKVQRVVDVITWLAAERKGLVLFPDDIKQARAYADDAVARSQSSSEFMDKNILARGNQFGDMAEYVRLSTTLQSYMYAKTNVARERTKSTNFKDWKQASKWAGDMTMLYVFEGIVVSLIRAGLPDDDDDDGVFDDWIALAATQGVQNLLGGIPLVSQFTTGMRGYSDTGLYASGGKAVDQLWGQVNDLWDDEKTDQVDAKLWKSLFTTGGLMYGVPSGQINKTIDAIDKANNGEEVSPLEYLTGPKK